MFRTSYTLGAHSMSPLATPLVIPQLLWVAGFVLFLGVALLLFVRALVALISGDLQTVARLIGSRSVSEEVLAELGAEDPPSEPRR